MKDPFDITGKIAVVTGASSGLGAHFARVLAARGAKVAAVARRRDRLDAVVSEITATGGSALAIPGDVSQESSLETCLATVRERLGVPEILVNNAGVSVVRDAQSLSRADWDHVIGTNLTGAWLVAQRVACMMIANGRGGSIINISSIAGARRILANAAPYVASKAGLTGLTKTFSRSSSRP